MKQPYHNYVDEETGEPAGKDFDDMINWFEQGGRYDKDGNPIIDNEESK